MSGNITDKGFPEDIMKEIQQQRQDLDRIRKQRIKVQELKEEFERKQLDMNKLISQNKELMRYKPYYDNYAKIKTVLEDTANKLQSKDKENQRLYKELDQALKEIENLHKKIADYDKNRMVLIKERTQLERLNKEIEQTFLMYKKECKNKEKQLIDKLDKANKHIKQSTNLLDQIEHYRNDLEVLRNRLADMDKNNKELLEHNLHLKEMIAIRQTKQVQLCNVRYNSNLKCREEQEIRNQTMEMEVLRKELIEKEKQLQKSKALNHELSIEFDRSVTKIGDFERELSEYRRENHELKKTLTLFIEKGNYDRMRQSSQRTESEYQEQLEAPTYQRMT